MLNLMKKKQLLLITLAMTSQMRVKYVKSLEVVLIIHFKAAISFYEDKQCESCIIAL